MSSAGRSPRQIIGDVLPVARIVVQYRPINGESIKGRHLGDGEKMQRTLSSQNRFRNNIILAALLFWMAELFLYLAFYHFGMPLIADIYYERSFSFLNEILAGRDSHSLEHYHGKADVFVYKTLLWLSLVPFLYALTVVWIKRGGPDQVYILRVLIFSLPILLIALFHYMKVEFGEDYWLFLTEEDGIIEYLTSAMYFIAFCIALLIANGNWKMHLTQYAIMYYLLSGGLFFISMEEISWGQRIADIETPEVLESLNYQGEMNIHNLLSHYSLHFFYMVVGFYGAFSRIVVPRRFIRRYQPLADLVMPNLYLFMYFFPAFALYMYYAFIKTIAIDLFGPLAGFGNPEEGYILSRTDEEVIEFILGLGFLLFVVINRYRQVSPGAKTAPLP